MYRVLLVEDEEIIRKGIRYSVPWEECGCSVVGEAENGVVKRWVARLTNTSGGVPPCTAVWILVTVSS